VKTARSLVISLALTAGALLGCASPDGGGAGTGGAGDEGGSGGGPSATGGKPAGSSSGGATGSGGSTSTGSGGSTSTGSGGSAPTGSGGAGGGSSATGGSTGTTPDAGAGAGGSTATPDGSAGGMGGGGSTEPTGGAIGSGNPASMGLDRHDALICGEWQKTTKPGDTIYLIKGGKVVWTYSLSSSGGNEFGDCTLTSYGTVFYPLKGSGAFEMKVDIAKGKGSAADLVWSYHQDGGTEVHSVQPIGKDKALVMQNGNPAKLMLIDKTKSKDCTSKDPCVLKTWNPDSGGTVHGMFRHVRMLANGNLLIPYTGGGSASKGHVKEYTQDWKVVWDYDSGGSPWAAVRLHNGNTLVSGNGGGWFREISPDLKVVWEITKAEFPSTMYLAQGAHRLKNGNTIVANWCGPAGTGTWPSTTQYWEVTPDKKFVWTVKSWTDPNLGPGSSLQALDDPGVPENPGELQR
jgi:hypothetical protein